MKFGGRLREERKRNNLSTEALATACGVARSYITLIEGNKRLPGKKVIPKIAIALNLKTSVVLNWYLEDVSHKMQKHIDNS